MDAQSDLGLRCPHMQKTIIFLRHGFKLVIKALKCQTWDELHKASVTERFVALRNATVRYQKALRSAL